MGAPNRIPTTSSFARMNALKNTQSLNSSAGPNRSSKYQGISISGSELRSKNMRTNAFPIGASQHNFGDDKYSTLSESMVIKRQPLDFDRLSMPKREDFVNAGVRSMANRFSVITFAKSTTEEESYWDDS